MSNTKSLWVEAFLGSEEFPVKLSPHDQADLARIFELGANLSAGSYQEVTVLLRIGVRR